MQLFFIFVCIKLAATPSCSPGPKEAGRGAFSAIQRISTKYTQFDFSTLFDFKPMHVTGTTYTFRFYDKNKIFDFYNFSREDMAIAQNRGGHTNLLNI